MGCRGGHSKVKRITGGVVAKVKKGGIAATLGIKEGDKLLSINGKALRDIIDYQYLSSDARVTLNVLRGEELFVFEVEKLPEEPLGIEFSQPLFNNIKRCNNKCIFCFVDQMAPNLRDSLYIKDDDYRLSFLYGNFITLTNLSSKDIKQILHKRLSPLYISLHSLTPDIREYLFQNSKAKSLDTFYYLLENGIQFHIQIVLLPGINDGEDLDNSIQHLIKCFPGVQSVAVVPVGLTKFRNGLTKISPVTKELATKVILQIEKYQRKCSLILGTNFVFLADEFFLLAEKPLPSISHYEDFPQLENGVGLIAFFFRDYVKGLRLLKKKFGDKKKIKNFSLVTGKACAKMFRRLADVFKKFNLFLKVIPIENNFWGKEVNVSGLLTGSDILKQISPKRKELGDLLLLPSSALSEEGELLDGYTCNDLASALGLQVVGGGFSFCDLSKTIIKLLT